MLFMLSSQAQPCLPAASCTPGNAPAASANLGLGIFRVQVANLDTTTNGANEGYQDYSCRRAIRLARGTTYTLRITTGTALDEQVNAWADFNQDGVFDPVTELVLSSLGRQHTSSFTVPTTIAAGASLRLRIAADNSYAPVPGPCTTPQYSQTEDYRVVITAAAPPAPQAAFSAVDSVTCGAAIQLRDHSRNAPLTWRWDFGDGTTSTQQHPTHAYAVAGTYPVRLRVCNASGCDSLRKPAFILVRTDGPKVALCQPATQAYCCQYGLDRVRLVGIDHRPGGGAAGYQDASCAQRATLRADWPDTLRLTTSGQGTHDVRVYLDLNDDGQFTPATELLYQGLGVKNPAIVLRISSLTASVVYNKALRLRICADYAGSPAVGPCAPPQWGQVADYSVSLLPNTLAPRAAFQLAYTHVCGPVQVTATNTSIGSVRYRWDFGDGTTSLATVPPVHTYATPGSYRLRLVAYSPTQADSVEQVVAVATTCPTYCTAGGWGGNTSSPLYFTRVKVADVDNQEVRGPGVGYRDFTQYVATVRQGQTLQLRTESQPFTSGGTRPWVLSTAWVDFNQDGYFSPSEQLGQYSGYSPHLGTFRVPHQAKVGATRMRLVIYLLSGTFYNNGCLPASYLAATEDYTMVVLPEQAAPVSGFTADLPLSCSGQVQFRDTTWASPTTWHWTFGDGSSSSVQHPTHRYPGTGSYTVSLQTSNAYGTHTATRAAYVTVTDTARGPRPMQVPLASSQLCCTYGIAQAQLATLVYQGGINLPGYRDESCQQPALQLVAGASYPISVMRTARVSYHQVYLWLDANNDGYFDATERIFTSTGASTTFPKVGTFTIPLTAVRNRPLRLRLFWHAQRNDDFLTPWVVPDPQTRDEDYDQLRDFTVVINGALLATTPGVETPSNQLWSVYPNPAAEQITLTQLNTPQEVQLVNSLGQVVRQELVHPTSAGACQVDVRTLANGLYLVRLTKNGTTRPLLIAR